MSLSHRFRVGLLFLACTSALAPLAKAVSVTLHFSGTFYLVLGVDSEPLEALKGTTITGSFTYEAPSSPLPRQPGLYFDDVRNYHVTAGSIAMGPHHGNVIPSPSATQFTIMDNEDLGVAGVTPSPGVVDHYRLYAPLAGAPTVDGLTLEFFQMDLWGPNNLFDSAMAPITDADLPPLDAFTRKTIALAFDGPTPLGGQNLIPPVAGVEITYIGMSPPPAVGVPDTTPVAVLLGVALGGLGWSRRRQ